MKTPITRQQRRALVRKNQIYPVYLVEVTREFWPEVLQSSRVKQLYRSRDFLVQVVDEPCGERLSICRTAVGQDNRNWEDKITWDELQLLKRECGRGDRWAVEIYPPEASVVNVANLRHLWVLNEAPGYGWEQGR